jgi:hypothetical protein
MKKIIFLLLSSFLMTAQATPVLLIERDQQQVHFVYPDLEANKAYYYAVWHTNQSNCEKIKSNSLPLVLINTNNKIYQLPKKKGFLCLRHSDKLLSINWNRFQIKPDEKFTMTETDDSRGVVILGPDTGFPDETNQLLPCEFETINEISVCELKL